MLGKHSNECYSRIANSDCCQTIGYKKQNLPEIGEVLRVEFAYSYLISVFFSLL